MKKHLNKKVKIMDAITSPGEMIRESVINFLYGFMGNSIVVFMAKEIDMAVFVNFILYYTLLSFIINRAKYETNLGKFIVLPGAAAIGAFTGYKVALILSKFI